MRWLFFSTVSRSNWNLGCWEGKFESGFATEAFKHQPLWKKKTFHSSTLPRILFLAFCDRSRLPTLQVYKLGIIYSCWLTAGDYRTGNIRQRGLHFQLTARFSLQRRK